MFRKKRSAGNGFNPFTMRNNPAGAGRQDAQVFRWQKVNGKTSLSELAKERSHMSATVVGSKVFVFGGSSNAEGLRLWNTLYTLEYKRQKWRKLSAGGVYAVPRDGHTLTLVDDMLVLIGDNEDNLTGENIGLLDLNLMEWFEPQVYGDRHYGCFLHSADYLDSLKRIIVFGGKFSFRLLNDLCALNLETMEWQNLDAKGTYPEPRFNHCSAVANDNLYIFGGSGEELRLNDMHILSFNPTYPTWSKVHYAGQLQGVIGATITNCNGRLIIFGGSYTAGWQTSMKRKGNLHIFDTNLGIMHTLESPSEGDGSQQPFSTVYGDSPGVRSNHAAVYCSSGMIVIGGITSGNESLSTYYQLSIPAYEN